jgi:hypothetical protein
VLILKTVGEFVQQLNVQKAMEEMVVHLVSLVTTGWILNVISVLEM